MCGGRVEVSGPRQTRVGVATKLVVIGDPIGSVEVQEDGIVGQTPNLVASHGSMPRRSNSSFNRVKDDLDRYYCKRFQRMITARAAIRYSVMQGCS